MLAVLRLDMNIFGITDGCVVLFVVVFVCCCGGLFCEYR